MSKMKLALVLMGLLVFISISLAASVQKSFTVVVDRSAPVVSCTGDTQLTNGGHGNSNDDRPNKDFHVEVQASKSTDISAPIIAVGVSTDAVETELYVKGSEEIYQKEGYPYIPDPNYYSDDSFRSGSGHFDVSTDDDMNDENWNHRDNKKFDFGVYSSRQGEEVTVKCNAYDLLGQEGESSYTAYSTEIKFCGQPPVQHTETIYWCLNDNGNLKDVGDYKDGVPISGDSKLEDNVGYCKDTSQTSEDKVKEAFEKWIAEDPNRQAYYDKYGTETYEQDIDNTVRYYPLVKAYHYYIAPKTTDGDCCASLDMEGCSASDSRFTEYWNGYSCAWFSGSAKCPWSTGYHHVEGCIDYDSYLRIENDGCFGGTNPKDSCHLTDQEYSLFC